MRLFISYHTPDYDAARRLVDALKASRLGLDIYFAPRVNLPGAYWLPKLADELERCDGVIFLAGERVGPWQEVEYIEAMRLSKQAARAGKPLILPIVIAKQAPGLPFFNLYHQVFAADPAEPNAIEAIVRALDGVTPPQSAAWLRFNPYKGLAAFTSADSAYFFGREKLTADVLTALAERPSRAFVLVGSSGVGKSSVAQAGVLAALRSQRWPGGGNWPESLADSRSWLSLTIRPEDRPLHNLALAFARLFSDERFQQDREAKGWEENFRWGSTLADLMAAAKRALAERLGSDAPSLFVIYVDQGEELYASIPKDGKPNEQAAKDAALFSQLLAEAATRPDAQVLLSLRSDHYGQLQADVQLWSCCDVIDVPPLDIEALQTAIQKPAVQLGVRFKPEDMPAYLAGATAREAGALPLLAYLLSDMWLQMQGRGEGVLRWDDTPLLDISAALRLRADRFRAQNKAREGALQRLFTLRLAQVPRLGDVIKRRGRRSECKPEEWCIAEELAGEQWRLVTLSGHQAGDVAAEVAHEQILRKWPALVSWLDERREFLTWKAVVEEAREDYDKAPTAEKPDALLTGRRLLIARQWLRSHREDLAAEERAFVEASIDADDRRTNAERRRLKEIAAAKAWVRRFAMTGSALVVLGALAFAAWQRHELAKQELLTATAKVQEAEAVYQKKAVVSLIERIRVGRSNDPGIRAMKKICDDVISTTSILASTSNEIDYKDNESHFWELYDGPMNLIEIRQKTDNYSGDRKDITSSPIESAMVEFGKELSKLKTLPRLDLKPVSLVIEKKCNAYLQR
jgi:hypothetical protein